MDTIFLGFVGAVQVVVLVMLVRIVKVQQVSHRVIIDGLGQLAEEKGARRNRRISEHDLIESTLKELGERWSEERLLTMERALLLLTSAMSRAQYKRALDELERQERDMAAAEAAAIETARAAQAPPETPTAPDATAGEDVRPAAYPPL